MTYDTRDIYDRLPQLEGSAHLVTSQPTDKYNCVGWVNRELEGYYAPGIRWPHGIPAPRRGEQDVQAYIALFESWGFVTCETPDLEDSFLKIAIYAKDGFFHHVAKQLPSGAWSSKIGEAHDVRHEQLDALDDSAVFFDRAQAAVFMKRSYDGVDRYEVEERGYLLPDGVVVDRPPA